MTTKANSTPHRSRVSVAESIRQRVEARQEGYWRQQDFASFPATAVSQTLSRLAKQGYLQRIGKGLYYRARPTVFGKSRPSLSAIQNLPVPGKTVFPAGVSAANLLGFTTQNPMRSELATSASSYPRTIIGKEARIHTRRPEAWKSLSITEAALLDFIRQCGAASELSPEATALKLLDFFENEEIFERLVAVASSEPPRVRAILGAVGQQLGKSPSLLLQLRESLNTLSRFDFGNLSGLTYAHAWQAQERKTQ